MLALIIGLLLSFFIVLAGGERVDNSDETLPVTISGTAATPVFLQVYRSDGALQAEWLGRQYGVIGWTRTPELLVFTTHTSRGYALVGGDPTTGVVRWIAPMAAGWLNYSEDPHVVTFNSSNETRRIVLPGALVQPAQTAGYPTTAGDLRVTANGVSLHDSLLVADRGLRHTLLASPSGQWIAAIEQRPASSRAIYSIDVRGGDTALERVVEYAELPLALAKGDMLSPNLRWVVTLGSVQTVLRHTDGHVRILPIGSSSLPIWKADSSAFLLRTPDGITVVDTVDATLEIIIHDPVPIVGWQADRILWLSQTIGSDE